MKSELKNFQRIVIMSAEYETSNMRDDFRRCVALRYVAYVVLKIYSIIYFPVAV